jgi:hypothetical protein
VRTVAAKLNKKNQRREGEAEKKSGSEEKEREKRREVESYLSLWPSHQQGTRIKVSPRCNIAALFVDIYCQKEKTKKQKK